ncbi:hypothetical protein CR51_05400 [Caballeronia megalochromosomata]|nr:hypothetical protein CR51_05400 [Caballeronia megalochromosomata]
MRAAGSSFSALSGTLSGEPILSGPYDPATQEAKLKAAREATDGGNESGGGFDWLGAAEAAGGALADAAHGGGTNDDSVGGDSMLKSFGDSDGGGGGSLLGDAQPFEYEPDELSDEVEELAGTTNERYAAKMLGYGRSTFREMIHRFKRVNGVGPNDDLEFEENGDVSFNGEYIDNFHDYGN